MDTVFSHIVQKRLSPESENVATEALAFIVNSSKAARSGIMKIIHSIEPDLPDLRFQAQKTKEGVRPDLWGLDGETPRVFIESKFWAGFTENQPVKYLECLREKPAVLLVVAPAARQETIWRELLNRLGDAEISSTPWIMSVGGVRVTVTDLGPILALTSWDSLLSEIEAGLLDDPRSMNDLAQLRALCDAEDRYASLPLSCTYLTDQRIPALILQVSSIIQRAVQMGISAGFLSIQGLRPQASWEWIGRYIAFPGVVGAWIGIDFLLWRRNGATPLWLKFSTTEFGRAAEVREVLEPWAEREGLPSGMTDRGWFAVGIDLATGEEMAQVVKCVVDRLRCIGAELSK